MAASPRAIHAVRSALPVAVAFLSMAVIAACGDDDGGADVSLSPAGEAGEQLFKDKGCAGCHNGEVAPSFEGLAGSEVTLDDGSTVVADDEYLIRSITDPVAQQVDGFSVKMPATELTDEEVGQLVAYIRDLSPSATAGSVTTP